MKLLVYFFTLANLFLLSGCLERKTDLRKTSPTNLAQNSGTHSPVAYAAGYKVISAVFYGRLHVSDEDQINTFRFEITKKPVQGAVKLTNAETGQFEYTVKNTAAKTDEFSYKVSDGFTVSQEATVKFTLEQPQNAAPIVLNGNLVTFKNMDQQGILVGSDADGDSFTYRIKIAPLQGQVLNLNGITGTFTYHPNTGFVGNDQFTFEATDSKSVSTPAAISIQVLPTDVTPTNHAPVANNLALALDQDTSVDSHFSATDIDGNPLTYRITKSPIYGTVAVTIGATQNFRYTPSPGKSGADSFEFKANDGLLDSNAATVAVTIRPVVKPPVCTVAATLSDVRIWKLSNEQYNNTVKEILGDTTNPADQFERIGSGTGFKNGAQGAYVSQVLSEQYMAAAETLAAKAVTNTTALLSMCNPISVSSETCIGQFIDSFGKKAFRKPVASTLKADYIELYRAEKTNTNATTGLQAVIEAALQSPHFIYRFELGEPGSPGTNVPLTSYEMASQLSYLLWNSVPDATLMSLADQNMLKDKAKVNTQVERMLTDPKALNIISEYFSQFLNLPQLSLSTKDGTRFPEFNSTLANTLLEESRHFLNYVMWQGTGTLNEVLTANYTFVNQTNAPIYGISGITGSAFRKVSHVQTERSGLLTNGSFLSVMAHPEEGSPVQRGLSIRRRLLCDTIADPPDNVANTPPTDQSGVTTNRDRYKAHLVNSTCIACHQYMDLIGFGFENFDAIGKFRSLDNGFSVDATGEVRRMSGGNTVPFNGAKELNYILSNSPEVSSCMSKSMFRYTLGRLESSGDTCALETIEQGFNGSGRNLVTLLKTIIKSDTFFYRRK